MTRYNNAPTRAICANSLTLNYMVGGKHLSFSALRHFFAIYAAQDCFLLRFFYCPLERENRGYPETSSGGEAGFSPFGFAFLLRASAIRTSSIALGLASVPPFPPFLINSRQS